MNYGPARTQLGGHRDLGERRRHIVRQPRIARIPSDHDVEIWPTDARGKFGCKCMIDIIIDTIGKAANEQALIYPISRLSESDQRLDHRAPVENLAL
jgi:hypothetical protein